MVSWITVLAYIHTCKEALVLTWNRFRRQLLVPLAHSGPRDMVLLKSGQWVDAGDGILDSEVSWRYDAEKHQLAATGSDGRMIRWKWIGASVDGRDMMDFFEGLRLSAGHALADDKAMALYTCQKSWVPTGSLHVTLRDGNEEQFVIRHGFIQQPNEHTHNDVDYIR